MNMTDILALLILGFKETDNPTAKQINEAFKRISLICHPDTGGSTEMFRGLTVAKNRLLDSAPEQKKSQSNQTTYNQEECDNKKLTSLNREISKYSDMISFHIYSFISKRVDLFRIEYDDNIFTIYFNKSGKMNRKYIDFFSSEYSTSQVMRILDAFNSTLYYLNSEHNRSSFNKTYTYNGDSVNVTLTLLPWYKSFGRFYDALLCKSYGN